MKRTISLILAALLLASSMTACGNTAGKTEPDETNPVETNAPATDAPETDAPDTNPPATNAPETDAPVPSYDTSLITENSVAKAHIVLLDGASAKEQTAAEELAYHIKLVSGADITVTNTPADDSLPIIIATPDSLPELEALFPEDLVWLRTTGKVGDMERWGSDGFAVRQLNGKIYIFGATPSGALNGVYDFIEENLDLIWILSGESGIIYDEMPTINVVKADYREKSPFEIRYGNGENLLTKRNKYNTDARPVSTTGHAHTVHGLVTSSPIYDPNITEYWETTIEGVHCNPSSSRQINYWSQLTADTIAASVIAYLDTFSDADRPKYFTVSQEDNGFSSGVYPEQTLPFEYAPGQFVNPGDESYISTVYFTFVNRVARKVGEKYPDVTINTLAYSFSVIPPVCDIDKNVSVWYCPYSEDYTQESFAVALAEAKAGDSSGTALEALYYEIWVEKHPNIMLYTYYWDCKALEWYARPIWDRFQNDCQYYASTGVLGWYADGGLADNNPKVSSFFQAKASDCYIMNTMNFWLYYKLMWNPYEDVDALIKKYCDKVYGTASEYMQEYYNLLEYGWNYTATEILPYEFNAKIQLYRDSTYYYNYFMDFDLPDGTYFPEALYNVLSKAYEAADDRAKEFIRYPLECYEDLEQFLS